MERQGYPILKPRFLLRGWEGLRCGVTDAESGLSCFFPENVYDTLRLCSGAFPADSPVFPGARREHLKALLEQGVIELVPAPASLAPEQEYVRYENRWLEAVHWSMTGRCNYRCRHCYMSAPHARLPEPDTAACRRIIDEIAGCGIRRVSLTGGEALIRKDFLELVDHMLARGLRITTIMSNGALVTETLLEELAQRGCRPEFNISYDGTEGWHDWLRGVPGAEAAAERAFLLCRKHGFPTGSELCLHRGNAHTLRESVKRLGQWGVGSLKTGRLLLTGEGAGLRELALSCREEYDIYCDYIPQYYEDGMPVKTLMLSGFFLCENGKASIPAEKGCEDQPNDRLFVCRAARRTMYLGPDGRVLPCIPMSETEEAQKRFPTLSAMSLREALRDSSYLSFIRTDLGAYFAHNPSCAACEYRYRCAAGCRGCAAAATGDLLGIDPDACLFFRGGYCERLKQLISDVAQTISVPRRCGRN